MTIKKADFNYSNYNNFRGKYAASCQMSGEGTDTYSMRHSLMNLIY
jgi:hypothetical protein